MNGILLDSHYFQVFIIHSKHNQIANFQQEYFQRLLQEEQEMNQRLRTQQIRKETEFGQQHSTPATIDNNSQSEQNQNNQNL